MTNAGPDLGRELLERVLESLGLEGPPLVDLDGLNQVCAGFVGHIPFDNVHKRIWFQGDQTSPITGGEPNEFFSSWLRYGTGGTYWPNSGGLATLWFSRSASMRGASLVRFSSMAIRLDPITVLLW